MERFLYFAYGMNTNPDQMDYRLGKEAGPEFIGVARLNNYRLRFAHYADIEQHEGAQVLGAVWAINKDHLAKLDVREGYPQFYDRGSVDVTLNGNKTKVLAYFMPPGQFEDDLPARSYWLTVKEGYEKIGIPVKQLHTALDLTKDQVREKMRKVKHGLE
jgi:gamma-glutamylcyclotransferase (GGCT)/AIG2-like uncharacterized protein YtfP